MNRSEIIKKIRKHSKKIMIYRRQIEIKHICIEFLYKKRIYDCRQYHIDQTAHIMHLIIPILL